MAFLPGPGHNEKTPAMLHKTESKFVMERPGLIPWLSEARATVTLALPLIFTQLAQMSVATTDVLLLGRLSAEALASSAVALTVFFFVWVLGFGPASAISPMIAHARGADPDDEKSVRDITRMGLWATIIISPFLMSVLYFSESILLFLGQDPALARAAGIYNISLSIGLPFSLGFLLLRNYVAALERPNSALWVMLATIIVNAIGNYALIFGHFGMPAMGLVGSGIASAFAHIFSFVVMLAIVRLTPALHQYRIMSNFLTPAWSKLSEVFRLGTPMSVTMTFEVGFFTSAALVMGTFGMASVAAHQIALNLASTTFMVPLGIAMAATVRVGLAAGSGDSEGVRRAGWTAIGISILFMMVSGGMIALFAEDVAQLYLPHSTENAAVIALTVVFLKVAAAFQLFDGIQAAAQMSIRGLKDAKSPMWICGISYWLIGFPVCFLLAFSFGLKGLGIWLGLAFGLFVAALALSTRFYYMTRR